MDLTLQYPGEHLFIRSVSDAGIQVVDDFYLSSLVLSTHEVIPDWPVKKAGDIERHHLERVLELNPEIVIVGTGQTQVFLPPELMMFFYERNVGIEVMTTDAACRTFNVLVSESRNVVAALIY
jgi:uncharacterized protein